MTDRDPGDRPLRIVQCAREIGEGFGVSGPALHLEREFRRLGHQCERFTLADLGLRGQAERPGERGLAAWLLFWRDILAFSFIGGAVLAWRFRRRAPGTVVVTHVDALYGDVFVLRSLQKALFAADRRRWWWCVRNPLHLLVLLRDEVRFRTRVHRHIVALSEENKQDLVRLYGVDSHRITVIPNGVETGRFRPDPGSGRAVRDELAIGTDGFLALFVANDFEGKGLRPLLEAVRLLHRDGADVHLVVAGRGAADSWRREFADLESFVRYVGHRLDLERWYAAADVFVLPTRFEMSPLAGREALASGLPVLMTDVGGVAAYLRDGRNGFFITTDPADIARKLRLLRDDPGRRAHMAKWSRESVAGDDWGRIAEAYVRLFRSLA
jgi:UDP-glucose:(heptosyl)LPS alpha-1,3-glucosyltransferase